MTIMFLGLRCDMVLVVAGIDSEDLLGGKHYNHAYLISSTSVRVNGGLMDSQHYSCINNDRPSLIMPPDSETVAPVSIRPHRELHRGGVP